VKLSSYDKKKKLEADFKESLLSAADNSGTEKSEHCHKLTLTAKSKAMKMQLKRRMLS